MAATFNRIILFAFIVTFCGGANVGAQNLQSPLSQSKRQVSDSGIKGDPFADDMFFSSDYPDDISKRRQAKSNVTLEMHGYLENRDRLRTSDTKFVSARQRLRLESRIGYGGIEEAGMESPLRGFVSGTIDIDPIAADLSTGIDTARVYLEEAYLTLDGPAYNLVIGKKIHRIGTGDGINPMDLINPLDYNDPFATGSSDARLPVLLGLATINLPVSGPFQEASIDIIFLPKGRVNELTPSGSVWESPGLKKLRSGHDEGLYIFDDPNKPDHVFKNAEYGIRVAATLLGWDLALIGFYTYLDSPIFKREYKKLGGISEKLHITPIHPDFSAFGFTFAKGLDRSTIRGELAVKPDFPVTNLNDGFSDYARTTVVEGVIGIDRTFGINLYINLQYFHTWIKGAEGTGNDIQDQGITYNLYDTFLQDDMTAGIRGILGFTGQGRTFETYIEYQLADDWLFQGSMLFFEGPETGAYGQYHKNDMVTLLIRYSF